MSDIEVVIKINKDFIDKMNSIKDDRELSWSQLLTVYRGFHAMLQHGTPLPKGHGKIGDLDSLIKRVTNLPKYPNGCSKVYDEAMIINIINNELAIIEADKGE